MRKLNVMLTPLISLGALPYAQAYDTTDRMQWRVRAATINSDKVANDEAVHAWRVAA